MSEGTRKLAAIMFTDIVGYTALSQRNEKLALHLLERHRSLMRPLFLRHKGREVKTIGDAFLVQFESALEAVECAIEMQEAIHNQTNTSIEELEMKVGIHIGDVVQSESDLLGDAVNIASRIEPLANGGEVCISQQAYDQVRNKVPFKIVKLEPHELKNVAVSIDVYRIELPWEREEGITTMQLDARRIAVLPFANMSPDPNDSYFADGMTEELITSLSGVKELIVIARTSVMKYKASQKGASEVGKELNAGTLVEGSVRKAGNRVRITAQLIDTRTEGHIWAQNYDRQLDDIFAIQTEIAEKVAEELRIQLMDSERKRLERRPTGNTEAYTLYLKGRFFWNERSAEGIGKATEYYKHAVNLDPGFALGYSGLADCYSVLARNHMAESGPSYQLAKQYALKALEVDQNLAEAHVALASVLTDYDNDPRGAESEYKRAIELKPSYSTAHQWYALLLGELRRPDEGLREVRKALELDPLSLIINTNLGDHLYYSGKLESAIEQYRKVIEMEPNFLPARESVIKAYVRGRMYDEALAEGRVCSEESKHPLLQRWVAAKVSAAKGDAAESLRLLDDVQRQYRSETISPYEIALVHFQANDFEGGFEWLQRAYDDHDGYIHVMAVDYELEGVREDPRYLQLLDKVGLGQVKFST